MTRLAAAVGQAVGQSRTRFARLPLSTRVGLLAAVGVGLAVALTALAAYLTVSSQLWRQVDQNLLDRARSAVTSPLADPARLVELPSEALGAADIRIAILRDDGQAVSTRGEDSAPPLGAPELEVARRESAESVRTATTASGVEYRVVAVPAGRRAALVLGQPTRSTEQTLDRLGLVTGLVGVLGITVAAWAGTAVARVGLRPVRKLTAAAEHVAATEELDPIPVEGDDEIARLTKAFNEMLAALGESRERQRQLVADAGHELRTPLTSLRTNLDLLAQSEQAVAVGVGGSAGGLDPADREQLLRDVRAQVEELSTLVSDLIELSRSDAPAAAREPVDLAEVVRNAVQRVRRRAPALAFAVDLRPWHLEGDAQLLDRAVTNLLDNAAKWSPRHGTVHVTLRDGRLTVVDEGPGISEHDLPHVFDRFYRSPEARGLPGSGLGLSIVRQAAERHGGAVAARRAAEGGAELVLTLPGRADSSRTLA